MAFLQYEWECAFGHFDVSSKFYDNKDIQTAKKEMPKFLFLWLKISKIFLNIYFLNKQKKTTQTASDGENFKSLFLYILKSFQIFKNIMFSSNMS